MFEEQTKKTCCDDNGCCQDGECLPPCHSQFDALPCNLPGINAKKNINLANLRPDCLNYEPNGILYRILRHEEFCKLGLVARDLEVDPTGELIVLNHVVCGSEVSPFMSTTTTLDNENFARLYLTEGK